MVPFLCFIKNMAKPNVLSVNSAISGMQDLYDCVHRCVAIKEIIPQRYGIRHATAAAVNDIQLGRGKNDPMGTVHTLMAFVDVAFIGLGEVEPQAKRHIGTPIALGFHQQNVLVFHHESQIVIQSVYHQGLQSVDLNIVL